MMKQPFPEPKSCQSEPQHSFSDEEGASPESCEEQEFSDDLEDYALFLLGSGALYGHTGSDRPEANVIYNWWDLSELEEESTETSAQAQPLECSNRMFVSFIAARNIAKGEELVVQLQKGTGKRSRYRFTLPEFASNCL